MNTKYNKLNGDFHIHTTYSDGTLTIEEIFSYCANNIDYLCITDHDYLESSIEASKIAFKYGIKALIGVEISTKYNDESVHILGYFPNDKNLDKLKDTLRKTRKNRLERTYKIKELLLKHFNINLNINNLLKTNSITRGNIAREIINDGYPYTIKEIFDQMIGENCIAYVPSSKITPVEAINLIHEAHGLAVLAHPVLLKKVDIKEIIDLGIDGLEAYYPKNKVGNSDKFHTLALKNHLFCTCGSDFHAFNDYKHGDLLSISLDKEQTEIFIKRLYKE